MVHTCERPWGTVTEGMVGISSGGQWHPHMAQEKQRLREVLLPLLYPAIAMHILFKRMGFLFKTMNTFGSNP